MSTKRSACPYDCPDGCSLLVSEEQGRITNVTGDPANPFTDGLVCGKVGRLAQSVHSPARILTPLRRTGPKGSGQFAPISWEEAVAEIARRWKALPPTSILPYSYAGVMGAVHRNCGEGFFHALGACRLVRTLCSSGKEAGWESVMGQSCDLSPWDLEHSDFILLWSTNVPATRLHLAPILRRAKARGVPILLLDVYENPSAALADETHLLQPGSDGALALSMLHVLEAEGLTDEGYLAAHTTGWPRLRGILKGYSPEAVAPIVGLSPEVIRALARRYAAAQAPAIVLGSGFSRFGNGGTATRAILALPAAVGAWAKRGGGTYGVSSSPDLVDRAPVKRPDWATDTPRINVNQLGQALEGDAIRSLYVYHANPAAVTSDQNSILRGLGREDLFTVVHERFLTDTALYADLVLPATFMVETEDVYTPYGYRAIQYVQPVLPPAGACKSNWEVFQLLAQAMGLTQPHFTRSVTDLCHTMISESTHLSPEEKVKVLAGEPVVQESPFPLPIETPDGRIHLAHPAPPAWQPPHGGSEPFRLVCAPVAESLNSSFLELPGVGEAPTLAMNGQDAAALGLAQGDRIRCFNELGEAFFTLTTRQRVAPGVVVAEGVFPGKNTVNALTHQRLSDLGVATTMNDNTVAVEKA